MKYKNLIIDNPNPAPTAAEVEKLEKKLGCKLPKDYLAFLKACNGGDLDYSIEIEFEDGSEELLSYVDLYCIKEEGEYSSNPYQLDFSRGLDGFPSQKVLPIACTGGGDELYIDMRDGYKIIAFVGGLPEWTKKRQEDALINVADSFDEYLSKLIIDEDYAECIIEDLEPDDGSERIQDVIEWLDSGCKDWRTKFGGLFKEKGIELK